MKAPAVVPVHLKLRLLATTEVFRDLTPAERESLHQLLAMVALPKGRIPWRPGQRLEALYVLKWGRVQVYRVGPDGRKLVTATLPRGTIFGQMAFAAPAVAETYCEAIEDSLVCVIGLRELVDVVRRFPAVALRLMEALSRRLNEMEARLQQVALQPARARLAALLLEMREERGPLLHITHRQLAEAVGCHRETVSRILAEMREAGLVSSRRGQVQVVDPRKLRICAQEG